MPGKDGKGPMFENIDMGQSKRNCKCGNGCGKLNSNQSPDMQNENLNQKNGMGFGRGMNRCMGNGKRQIGRNQRTCRNTNSK
ncbi:MAG: hypothetical protein PHO12_09520 [Bacteroidales bacterium]|jgi:hypothetical protein|nr:hypothetical protein [Bacteroidales bacterium]